MKIHVIFLCLLISNGWVRATTQTTISQDKPSRLYVKSYSFVANGSTTTTWHAPNPAGGEFTSTEYETDSESLNFADNSSGSYHATTRLDTENVSSDSSETITWSSGSWTNITGTEIYTDNGSSTTYTNVTVGFPQECGDINFTYYSFGMSEGYGGSIQENYRQAAATVVRLQTGGRAKSRLKNLFGITAGAHHFASNPTSYYLFNLEPGSIILDGYTTVDTPSQNIAIGSCGKLNANGVLYKILPDNAEVDVTPYVAGTDWYYFDVSAAKYHSYFDVFVQQVYPGYSLYFFKPTNDVGHAFWQFRTDAPSDALQSSISPDLQSYLSTPWGFYSSNAAPVADPGLFKNDSGHSYNISRSFYVGFPDLIKGLRYTKELHDSPPTYIFAVFNCVTAATFAGNAAGLILPFDITPQNFGVNLVETYPAPGQVIGPFIDTTDVFY